MYKGLLHAHSGFRYIVLGLLVFLLISNLVQWLNKRKYGPVDRRTLEQGGNSFSGERNGAFRMEQACHGMSRQQVPLWVPYYGKGAENG